jgi:hypothetical protein
MQRKTSIKLTLLAGATILLTLLACRFFGKPVTPTPVPPVPVDQLKFEDADTGMRFRGLDGCIRKLAEATWKGGQYELVGNFYEANWCAGQGSRDDCQIAGGTIDNRDQHDIQLYILFYPQEYPQVFGLGLQALQVPASTGWGANFYFAEKGKTIVGEGWEVTFRQYLTSSGPADATVSLGWKYTYIIEGPNRTSFELPSDLPLREDLAGYLASPEAMRDLGLNKLRTLAGEVEDEIRAHHVQGCDMGPYQNNGIPPVCNPRPMTAEEEAGQIELAQKYFDEAETLLKEHYREMYAAWMAAFPMDQCWPE